MFYLSGLFHLVLPDLQKSVPKVYRLEPLSNTQNFKYLFCLQERFIYWLICGILATPQYFAII